MKMLVSLLILTAAVAVFAQKAEDKEKQAATPAVPERPPVVVAPPPPVAPPPQPVYEYDQKLATGRAPLVTTEQAQTIIDKFKAALPKLGNPRLVVYVNRDLVDEDSGLKLMARTEKVNTTTTSEQDGKPTENEAASANARTSTTERAARENRYRRNERKENTLADRQTVRDVERLFGRPFRMAGARLADQKLATQMMPDGPLKSLATEGEQARKDREALAKIGDIAVEILVSSRKIDVAETSGTRTYELPDIQATALRLSDSEIIGQASSSDVMRGHPGFNARNYDVREVTEAVALALMDDITPTGAEK
jgi:hypothetical protein